MADIVDYVLGIMGIGKADAMSPQAQQRYKEATGSAINAEEAPAGPEIKSAEGQVNLKNNRRREELGEAELVTLLARQKAMADKARRGGY